MKRNKKKKVEESKVNPALKGLDIRVNEFGEIEANIAIERLNDFLDQNVIDKKLEEKREKEMKRKKERE